MDKSKEKLSFIHQEKTTFEIFVLDVTRDLDHPALLRLEGVYQDADNIVQVVYCKDTVPKFETKIPRKGAARLQSQFLHSGFCE